LASEFLQGPALDVSEPLIGFIDQVAERPKRDGRNGIRQGRQPRAEKIIGDVIAAALRFRAGKYRQLSLTRLKRSISTFPPI
jgi:hypothetical protein